MRLVSHLLHEGPTHRAELARSLSMSRGTITDIVQQLLEDDVLVEGVSGNDALVEGTSGNGLLLPGVSGNGVLVGGTNRPNAITGVSSPPQPLRLKQKLGISTSRGVFAHVAFRASSNVVALTALDGRLLGYTVDDRSRLGHAGDWLDLAHTRFGELLREVDLQPEHVVHLHAALNSQVDRITGEILESEVAGPWRDTQPYEHLVAWSPGAGLTLENTARLMALAELRALEHPCDSLIRIELSWGIGMGQVFAGRIVTGSHGATGELGHVSIDATGPWCDCGRRGCLWLYAGAGNVLDGARQEQGQDIELADVARAAASGDEYCLRLLTRTGEYVGEALATVCNLLGPDIVAVGGELSKAGEPLMAAIRSRLNSHALPLTLRHLDLIRSRIGDDPLPIIDAGHANLLNDADVVTAAYQRALR